MGQSVHCGLHHTRHALERQLGAPVNNKTAQVSACWPRWNAT